MTPRRQVETVAAFERPEERARLDADRAHIIAMSKRKPAPADPPIDAEGPADAKG